MGINERQDRCILFVHIPKTAGTTLRVLLEAQYAQQAWLTVQHDIRAERGRLAKMPESKRASLRFVFGHMEWGWHELLPGGRDYAYTTILRDPVERVLSLYSHCKVKGHYLEPEVRGMDIVRFLASGVTMVCDNGMVRQLCGRDRFLQKPWADMSVPLGGMTEDDLGAAIKHLNKCAVVGVQEKLDDYLERCRQEFAWRNVQAGRHNVSLWPRVKRGDLNKKELAAVEAATRLDRVLYEHAVEGGRG